MFFSFFLMLRRPPIFTLFPYTTLSDLVGYAMVDGPSECSLVMRVVGIEPFHNELGMRLVLGEDDRLPDPIAAFYGEPDRKSTRLNSSHVSISYAVFCLKKNNKFKGS